MSLSKRLRFEVFKRDSFTCQYCGAQAPAVLLEADHIHPRAKDGEDDITNLITSCDSCNRGKSDVSLSDNSAMVKRKNQLDLLQERREQLELMFEWHRELLELDADVAQRAADFFLEHCHSPNFTVSEGGLDDLKKIIKRYGLSEVLASISESLGSYEKLDVEGKTVRESASLAFNKIGPICGVRKQQSSEPHLKVLYYIRGILRNRLGNTYGYKDWACIVSLRHSVKIVPPEYIQDLALRSTTWKQFSADLSLLEKDHADRH